MIAIVVLLLIWNVLLTWYVFKHINVYNRTIYEISRAVPGLRVRQ